MGGLGNQLQQYALYRKYISLGTAAKLDISWFNESVQQNMRAKRKLEIDRFEGVSYEACTSADKAGVIGRDNLINRFRGRLNPLSRNIYDESVIYDPELLERKNLYLRGYFACEYYYADIMDELRRQLVLPGKPELDKIVSTITGSPSKHDAAKTSESEQAGGLSCSVHLRRGDYLEEDNFKMFGNICTDEYYESAIKYAVEKGADRFFIFSEDEEYALKFADKIKSDFHKDAVYVNANKGDDSCYDIYLMSLCDINICANSTFSFWGARLNSNPGKIMIRPTKQKNSQSFDVNLMQKYWRGWTFIDPEGCTLQ